MSSALPGTPPTRTTISHRLAASAALAAAALVAAGTFHAAPPPVARAPAMPFDVSEFAPVGGIAAGDSYRLRLDVRYDPSARAGEPAATQRGFCMMLERSAPGDYDCLVWSGERLSLLRYRNGERLDLPGRAAASLPLMALVGDSPQPFDLRLVVDRAPRLWSVSFLGEEILLAPAADRSTGDAAPRDDGALAPFAWAAGARWQLVGRTCQPAEAIEFSDAFERATLVESDAYEFASGDWKLDAVRDTSRAMNAFRLRGRADAAAPMAVATTGHDFWRAYRICASIKFPSKDVAASGGLVFASQSPGTMGLVRWRCLPSGEPTPGGQDRYGRALLEVVEATRIDAPAWAKLPAMHSERVLLSLPWRPRAEQWYRVSVSIFDETGEIEVDGRRREFELPRALRSGACGLFSESRVGVLFDDVLISSHRSVRCAGDSPLRPMPDPQGAVALGGSDAGDAWYEVEPDVSSGGIEFAWQDAEGAPYRLTIGPGGARGGLTCFGQPLGSCDAEPLSEGESVRVELRERSCVVSASRHGTGRALMAAALPTVRQGGVRLSALRREAARAAARTAWGPLGPPNAVTLKSRAFDRVDVTLDDKGHKHASVRWESFTAWIEDRGSWRVSAGCAAFGVPLWGDFDITFRPSAADAEGAKPFGLELVPRGENAKPIAVSVRAAEGRFRALAPDGCAVDLGSATEFAPQARMVRFTRDVDTLRAEACGRVVGRLKLDAGIPVEVRAVSPSAAPSQVAIRSASVDESLFTSAPAEWVRWRGSVDMTDKWQCDPRWSFLGIWSDRSDTILESAGVFSRGSYGGDQHLRMDFALKDLLGGRVAKRRYVRRDLNFAFACSGEDLASGYCLMLGGYGNRGTQLLRLGQLVAESDAFRFPLFDGNNVNDLHWRWFALEITRYGGTVAARLDDREIITWTDPEPLEGGHVAAWVLGGGMVLGRTRFSSASRGQPLAAFDDSTAERLPPAGWRARDKDHAVSVREAPNGATRVTNVRGGGHFAVEYAPTGIEPPGAFAFRASPGTRVRASASYREGTAAEKPVAGAELLPADVSWHAFSLSADGQRAAKVFFGNYLPSEYLAAGLGGNGAGDWFEVMFFPHVRQAELFSLGRQYVDRSSTGQPE